MKRSTLILATFGACLFVGCGEDDDDDYYIPDDDIYIDDDLVDDAMDAAMVDQSQVAMDYAMTDPLYDDFYYDDVYLYQRAAATSPTPPTPEVFAAQIASGVDAYFVPQGCVTATSEGSTATVVFDGCDTAALGALDITGTATVTFAQSEGAYAAHIAATGLAINGGVLDLDVDATGSRAGDQRTLTATSTATWSGPNGTIDRELGATLRWTQGSGCVLVDGSGASELDGETLQGQLSGYRHCANECPAAGTLTWSTGSSELTLTFDGTSTPALVSSDGTERELDLTCEEP